MPSFFEGLGKRKNKPTEYTRRDVLRMINGGLSAGLSNATLLGAGAAVVGGAIENIRASSDSETLYGISSEFQDEVETFLPNARSEAKAMLIQARAQLEGGKSVSDYFSEEVASRMTVVPVTARAEIGRLIPFLLAQESGFDDDRVSVTGARTRIQILDRTARDILKRLRVRPADPRRLYGNPELQARVMAQFFDDAYIEIKRLSEPELETIRDNYFPGGETQFEVAFLAPLLLMSYNAGPTRLLRIVKQFAQQSAGTTPPLGYDPITRLRTKAYERRWHGFDREKKEYLPRIFAHKVALEEEARKNRN